MYLPWFGSNVEIPNFNKEYLLWFPPPLSKSMAIKYKSFHAYNGGGYILCRGNIWVNWGKCILNWKNRDKETRKGKKVTFFFAVPKSKYCRGFERAQPFAHCGHFCVIFSHFEAILKHLFVKLITQIEGTKWRRWQCSGFSRKGPGFDSRST